jgi:hypothetical protein
VVFRQRLPDLGLSVEMGTEGVPDDGQYHVVLNGDLVLSTSSKSKALARYRALRSELGGDRGYAAPDPEELLRKLRADAEIGAVLAESSRAKRANATHKRGGVTKWKQ